MGRTLGHLPPLSSPFLLSVIINLLPAECWRSGSGAGPLHTSYLITKNTSGDLHGLECSGPEASQGDPRQWVAKSGGLEVLGHPILPRFALARQTGIPLSHLLELSVCAPLPHSICHGPG